MNNDYTSQRTPHRWRDLLREAVIIAGSAGSGITTYMGAHQLVNASALVAALLTLFFQGGMYVAAHFANESMHAHRRPRTLALCLTWTLLAFFSVYSSALGMFELQKDSLKLDHTRAAVVQQWQAAEKEITDFKTKALAWLTKSKQDVSLRLTFERNRERAAHSSRRAYSPVEKQKIQSQLDALNSAESKAQQIKLLSGTTPAKTDDAVKIMDEAFGSAAEAFSALPDDGKAQCPVPRQVPAATQPEELQKAFWAEVQARSAPAMMMLLIAFLMDFLPVLLRYASRPKRTLAEKITGARRTARGIWSALWHPLAPVTQALRVVVEDHPDLDITLQFATGREALTLNDVRRNITVVADAVSEQLGSPVRLTRAMTTSGMELVPDLPLLSQLDDDLTIHLSFEPVTVEV
jgi:hypothetical protein